MTTLHNEITIRAPLEKIWGALSGIENLDKFDPTVKKSTALSEQKSGIGAKRKVDMQDGTNWFEERVTVFKTNEALTYQLTACSFPMTGLTHNYTFEKNGDYTKVKQVMEYTVKFGLLGKLLDTLMIRKKTNAGIQKFLTGLKGYVEKN